MKTALSLFLLLDLSACGYRECGTIQLVTTDPDTLYDADNDGDVDFSEGCGVDVGAFGYHYPDWDLAQVMFDTSHWDISEGVDVVYDYLPIAQIQVRWSDLQVEGAVLGIDRLGGNGIHIVSGNSLDSPTSFALTDARLEVIKAPAEFRRNDIVFQDDEGFKVRLAYDLTFGEGAERYEGEDWFFLRRDRIVYTDLGDFFTLPPDYEAP